VTRELAPAVDVVHETIDGETIVIDLATGTYYSLEGSGAELWAAAAAGHPPATSVPALAARHADPAGATAELEQFVDRLVEEGLLVESPGSSADLPLAVDREAPYVPPALSVYTDMQAFLLADPLHDVEEAGWPHVKA